MKGKIKQGLEKIVNFVKDNSKKAIAIGVVVAMSYAPVNAAEIQIVNALSPTNPSVDNMSAYMQTFSDANEINDIYDGDFLESPKSNAMEVFSYEPGVKSRVNTKPLNTPYGEFNLGIKGEVTGNNVLRLRVNDAIGLEHRNVIAYDINDPNTIHDVPKNGDILEVSLSPLVNQPAGEYATWRIETPALVSGDCASALGPGKLDGKVDNYDIQTLGSNWLNETFEGDNYNNADVNYDGLVNFKDFAIGANNYTSGE